MIRSGLFVFFGNALASLILFVRNVVLARMLPIEDYGIAMTFVIIVSAMELASNMASDRMLVQAPDGDGLPLQSTVQTLEIWRGIILGIGLFFLAAPIATFFRIPEATFAFQLLALVPPVRGLRHLDIFRLQRKKDFRGFVLVPLLAQSLATLMIVPLALWLNDYRAMLFSVLAQHAAMVILSHTFAKRPYRLRFEKELAVRIVKFGWPLMLNGALMFVVMNGDRMIVGNQFGPTELGWFSAAFTLALTPTLIIDKTLQTLFLPMLSRRRNTGRNFYEGAQVVQQMSLFAGVGFAVLMAIVGPWMFLLLFGEKFRPAVELLPLLCVAQGLRVSRSGPSTIAVATSQTTNPAVASAVRVASLPLAFLAAWVGAELHIIVLIAIAGEGLSYLTSVGLLQRRVGMSRKAMVIPLLATAISMALIILIVELRPEPTELGAIFTWTSLVLCLILAGNLIAMSDARRFMIRRFFAGKNPPAPDL